jgi:hypothetical protein
MATDDSESLDAVPEAREQDLDMDDVQGDPLSTAKDRFGFFLNDDFHRAQPVSPALQEQRMAKELSRQKKWSTMRQRWQNHFRYNHSRPVAQLSIEEARAVVSLHPNESQQMPRKSSGGSVGENEEGKSQLQQQTIATQATHRPLSLASPLRLSVRHPFNSNDANNDPHAVLREQFSTTNPYVSGQLKRRVRKGVPDSMRGEVWFDFVDAVRVQRAYPIPTNDIDISRIPKNTLEEIERDIDRTFPRHALFIEKDGAGQVSLRKVLQWYAALDTEVGYCQGMGFVAALFLTYMPEDKAFFTFYATLTRRKCPLRMMFLPKLVEMQVMLHVIDRLGQLFLPRLWQHFTSEGVHVTMFFTEWAMAFFCRGFSFELVTRMWDVLLLEGRLKMVYRVSLAILQHVESRLLELKFDKIIGMLRDLPNRIDSHRVMDDCWQLPLKTQQIVDIEEEVSDHYCLY